MLRVEPNATGSASLPRLSCLSSHRCADITETYEALGLSEQTLFILTGDNGGIPYAGGFNYPLRGCKATTFEGGVRSIAFISGAGLAPAVRGTISHEVERPRLLPQGLNQP